jgi:DNA-binding GntR family transcriptional regulator
MSRSRKKTTAARPRRKGDVAADKAVYDAIRRAILMGYLSPGTKLQEPLIARLLGVSRERVRKALHRFVHEGWLEAVPNRGTFIPALGIGEVREIYDVRKMLEAGIVRRLSGGLEAAAAKRLRAHINAERKAVAHDDRGRLFDLSGEFHVLLAELCGNAHLSELVRRLLTRSTLHFSLFAPDRFHNCAGPHDHGDIVKAILARDADRASTLMLDHLSGLIELQSAQHPPRSPAGLEEVFRAALARPRRRGGA